MKTHNFEKLKKHIFELSVEKKDFDKVKEEWNLDRVYISTELSKCPCGVQIKEHCYIKNKFNEKTTYVGNVCVKQFMKIDAGSLFAGLKKIERNNNAVPNLVLTNHANEKGYLYDAREYNFLIDMQKSKRRSNAQKQWLYKINRRILKQITVQHVPNQIP